jgi:hypothetical protein
VEEDDALADRHRPGAPREDGLAGGELGDIEDAEPVQERGDVPARDRDGIAALHDLGDLGDLIGDHRALERLVALIELLAVARATLEMHAVEIADRLDRGARLVLEDVLGRLAIVDHVLGVQRVLQPDAVEVLPVPEDRLALAMRRMERRVLPEHLLGAGVETEVDRAAAEVLLEVVVLLLELLPAGRDRSDASLDAQLRNRFPKRRVESLRAEKNNGARLACDHAARTFNVCPTVSSIERRVS